MKKSLKLFFAILPPALCATPAHSAAGGAIPNEKATHMKKVNFPNRNINIAANLYLPCDFDPSLKYPAIIVGHPAGGVKEQTAGLYAKKLAEKGFAALAFDASYQGESGGEPRGLEDPAVRAEDFRCAADFLSTLPYIDVSGIGAMGICGGGGFAVSAAATDHRIRAVAGVSAVDLGRLRREGLNGVLAPSLQERLDAAARQRIKEANGGGIKYASTSPNRLTKSLKARRKCTGKATNITARNAPPTRTAQTSTLLPASTSSPRSRHSATSTSSRPAPS